MELCCLPVSCKPWATESYIFHDLLVFLLARLLARTHTQVPQIALLLKMCLNWFLKMTSTLHDKRFGIWLQWLQKIPEHKKKRRRKKKTPPQIEIYQLFTSNKILMIFSFSVGLSNHEERPCKHGTFSKGSQAAFQGHWSLHNQFLYFRIQASTINIRWKQACWSIFAVKRLTGSWFDITFEEDEEEEMKQR